MNIFPKRHSGRVISILIFFLFFYLGCATSPNVTQLHSLKPGVTKNDVIERFGQPLTTDYVDGHFLLKYRLYQSACMSCPMYLPYYFVFKNDVLVSWQEIKEDTRSIIVNGIILTLP